MKNKIPLTFCLIIFFVQTAFPCTINISSIKTNAIFGRVITETKEIVSFAKIHIYKNTDDGEMILAESKSDENGRFEIKNFPAGKYMIRANAQYFNYSYVSIKLKKTSSKSIKKEILFTLVPNGDCSGRVEMYKIPKSK